MKYTVKSIDQLDAVDILRAAMIALSYDGQFHFDANE